MSIKNDIRDDIKHLKEDHRIYAYVRDELKWDYDITDQRDVDITVDYGVVSLEGYAASYAQKWAIERAVYRVKGVKGVQNDLQVRPPKDDVRTDHEIENAAKHALEWDARVPLGVRVDVVDGAVTLHGMVGRFAQREAAEEAVRNLLRVKSVANEIELAIAEASVDLKRDIEAVLRRRYDVGPDDVAIAVVDGVVTLSGVVPTFATRDGIEQTVWHARGVTRVDDQLQVGAPSEGP